MSEETRRSFDGDAPTPETDLVVDKMCELVLEMETDYPTMHFTRTSHPVEYISFRNGVYNIIREQTDLSSLCSADCFEDFIDATDVGTVARVESTYEATGDARFENDFDAVLRQVLERRQPGRRLYPSASGGAEFILIPPTNSDVNRTFVKLDGLTIPIACGPLQRHRRKAPPKRSDAEEVVIRVEEGTGNGTCRRMGSVGEEESDDEGCRVIVTEVLVHAVDSSHERSVVLGEKRRDAETEGRRGEMSTETNLDSGLRCLKLADVTDSAEMFSEPRRSESILKSSQKRGLQTNKRFPRKMIKNDKSISIVGPVSNEEGKTDDSTPLEILFITSINDENNNETKLKRSEHISRDENANSAPKIEDSLPKFTLNEEPSDSSLGKTETTNEASEILRMQQTISETNCCNFSTESELSKKSNISSKIENPLTDIILVEEDKLQVLGSTIQGTETLKSYRVTNTQESFNIATEILQELIEAIQFENEANEQNLFVQNETSESPKSEKIADESAKELKEVINIEIHKLNSVQSAILEIQELKATNETEHSKTETSKLNTPCQVEEPKTPNEETNEAERPNNKTNKQNSPFRNKKPKTPDNVNVEILVEASKETTEIDQTNSETNEHNSTCQTDSVKIEILVELEQINNETKEHKSQCQSNKAETSDGNTKMEITATKQAKAETNSPPITFKGFDAETADKPSNIETIKRPDTPTSVKKPASTPELRQSDLEHILGVNSRTHVHISKSYGDCSAPTSAVDGPSRKRPRKRYFSEEEVAAKRRCLRTRDMKKAKSRESEALGKVEILEERLRSSRKRKTERPKPEPPAKRERCTI